MCVCAGGRKFSMLQSHKNHVFFSRGSYKTAHWFLQEGEDPIHNIYIYMYIYESYLYLYIIDNIYIYVYTYLCIICVYI